MVSSSNMSDTYNKNACTHARKYVRLPAGEMEGSARTHASTYDRPKVKGKEAALLRRRKKQQREEVMEEGKKVARRGWRGSVRETEEERRQDREEQRKRKWRGGRGRRRGGNVRACQRSAW